MLKYCILLLMAINKIEAGQPAPNFDTKDVFGKRINLSEYRKKAVLLVFFRYAGCPWCNLAIHRLALEYPMLKKENCEVIAFVQSDKNIIKENIYGRHAVKPEFTIIADPKMHFYKLYGVSSSYKAALKARQLYPTGFMPSVNMVLRQTKIDGELFLVPAAFLVSSRTQEIDKADYGTSFYEFESFFKIYESLVFDQAIG